MPQLIDAARIANEPLLRYTPEGTAVINLSLPCDYGRKGQDGKKPTQWVDASLWAKQAEALAPYLVKGQWVSFTIDDAHNEEYQSSGQTRTKMVGRVSRIKLIGSAPAAQNDQPAQHSNHSQPAQSSQAPADFEDTDLPF